MTTPTPCNIGAALGLTNVKLYISGGIATITASEPVTPAMQARVQAWHDAGKIDPEANAWADFLAGHVTVSGIDLKASIEARDAFTGTMILIREGIDAGAITNATPMSIWDAHEQEHALTVGNVRQLLLAYGFAWKTAFDQLAP